jgi:hypothetical protein
VRQRAWIHAVGSLGLAVIVGPTLLGTIGGWPAASCPRNFGDPTCALQLACHDNADERTIQGYERAYPCCMTRSGGCCQYWCNNWACPARRQVRIGEQVFDRWDLCPSRGSHGTSRHRVTETPLANAVCVDPPGVCQSTQ